MPASTPLRNGLQLAAWLASAALLIAVLQLALQPRIAANGVAAEAQTRLRILPGADYDSVLSQDLLDIRDGEKLGLHAPEKIVIARRHGLAVAAIVPASGTGYTGPLDLLIAIARDGRVIGAEITAQRETPGIGDRVDRHHGHWLDIFSGHSLRNPAPEQWQLRGDGGAFDGVTGATITSRSATQIVRRALDYAAIHRDEWFPEDEGATFHE